MRISARGLHRSTLGRQLLLQRESLGVADAVHCVVTLQAQQAASSYLALWNRLTDVDPADLAAHGIGSIERVMTDNAFSYRHSHAAVAALGAKQKFIKPHCPWQNGKVERFNRTLQVE